MVVRGEVRGSGVSAARAGGVRARLPPGSEGEAAASARRLGLTVQGGQRPGARAPAPRAHGG